MNANPKIKSGFVRTAAAALMLTGSAYLAPPAMAQPATAGMAQPAPANSPDDVAGRIQRLHDQLQITPGQEVLWKNVAAAMQDNAKAIATAMQARADKGQTMNAVDDIVSYGAIATAHADGLKHLAAAFAPLYAAMPPAQQQNADMVFGHRAKPGQHP
jgi:hypothetical protein